MGNPGDVQNASAMRPYEDSPGAGKRWVHSGKPQRPNPETAIAELAHPAGHPVWALGPALDQACDDNPVRPTQAEHCDTLATLPRRAAQPLYGDRLPKHPEHLALGHLDGADNLAGYIDPSCRQHAITILGNNMHHMADLEIGGRTRLPVNPYWYVRRIGHPQAIDDDAAEPADCAHHTRAANAAITLPVGWNHSGTADATVPWVLASRRLQGDKEQRQRGQPASGSSCNRRGAVPHVLSSSSLRSLGLSAVRGGTTSSE